MGVPVKKEKEKYSYADYLTWPSDERWEIIDGNAYAMSPAPSRWHQKISVKLIHQFENYLSNKTCEIYHAPFDVRLPNEAAKEGRISNPDEIHTIVQPDIAVFCDKQKLDDRGAIGAPDLIIEILSPSSISTDMRQKLALYERVCVREYWIVDPANRILLVYTLDIHNHYNKPAVYTRDDVVVVDIFGDLTIDLKLVFVE